MLTVLRSEPSQGSNSFITGSGTYKWSSAYLRTPAGDPQSLDNGVALDDDVGVDQARAGVEEPEHRLAHVLVGRVVLVPSDPVKLEGQHGEAGPDVRQVLGTVAVGEVHPGQGHPRSLPLRLADGGV